MRRGLRLIFVACDEWFPICAVRFVQKDERKYYEKLMQYSREHLMVHQGWAGHV